MDIIIMYDMKSSLIVCTLTIYFYIVLHFGFPFPIHVWNMVFSDLQGFDGAL